MGKSKGCGCMKPDGEHRVDDATSVDRGEPLSDMDGG